MASNLQAPEIALEVKKNGANATLEIKILGFHCSRPFANLVIKFKLPYLFEYRHFISSPSPMGLNDHITCRFHITQPIFPQPTVYTLKMEVGSSFETSAKNYETIHNVTV